MTTIRDNLNNLRNSEISKLFTIVSDILSNELLLQDFNNTSNSYNYKLTVLNEVCNRLQNQIALNDELINKFRNIAIKPKIQIQFPVYADELELLPPELNFITDDSNGNSNGNSNGINLVILPDGTIVSNDNTVKIDSSFKYDLYSKVADQFTYFIHDGINITNFNVNGYVPSAFYDYDYDDDYIMLPFYVENSQLKILVNEDKLNDLVK